MEFARRNTVVYGLLLGVWLLVVGWQLGKEHARVEAAAKTDLRNRAMEITDTLGAEVHALSFRETLMEDRLQSVLDELVRTNQFTTSTGVIAIVLLNTAGEPLVTAGNTNVIPPGILSEGEHWASDGVTFVNPVWGASFTNQNTTNPVVVFSFRDFSNSIPRTNFEFNGSSSTNGMMPPPPRENDRERPGGGPRRPPWMRNMNPDQFRALAARRELHGLVLSMSTENLRTLATDDLWMRAIIIFFAGISAIIAGVAWRNLAKTSELQIRLIRASELNSHLKEMNLAAAGLAHETRNPLNIIRGMAQMISKSDAPPEAREKSRAIVDETDKVTAQLNEFINYSRPREVRRAKIQLNAAVAEVIRALDYDIAEKKIRVENKVASVSIEADEQLLRQVLFNLLLNATQAVGENGQIQFSTQKNGGAEIALDVRDNGPGVPQAQRQEIFKPYFTTHQKGTGLGLAVVQQIVLAHGWEIQCLDNEPNGAVFRISHLKVSA
ncbi:MAG TPA: ATP-binding protein [Verrucomicrobiae bacterium]|jgi:signal transduction histidine kinase